ncbi:MAG: hypothetical protein KGI72_05405 [Patescibacteria group bacterium]|nr:hypothetical protein [Patescibacteria group bacterium]MDE2233097.1 hypothetical protein [Patescibacteria group bacterium]
MPKKSYTGVSGLYPQAEICYYETVEKPIKIKQKMNISGILLILQLATSLLAMPNLTASQKASVDNTARTAIVLASNFLNQYESQLSINATSTAVETTTTNAVATPTQTAAQAPIANTQPVTTTPATTSSQLATSAPTLTSTCVLKVSYGAHFQIAITGDFKGTENQAGTLKAYLPTDLSVPVAWTEEGIVPVPFSAQQPLIWGPPENNIAPNNWLIPANNNPEYIFKLSYTNGTTCEDDYSDYTWRFR